MNIEQVIELIEKYPNNHKLGGEIRKLYWEHTKKEENVEFNTPETYIYESPDGGDTIKRRPVGDHDNTEMYETQVDKDRKRWGG